MCKEKVKLNVKKNWLNLILYVNKNRDLICLKIRSLFLNSTFFGIITTFKYY